MSDMLTVQTQHEDKLGDQEGRSRRENIRIYNVAKKQGRKFNDALFRDKLDIFPTAELHIERAHRALVPKPTATGKPRSIVIKFHHSNLRKKIHVKPGKRRRFSETTRESISTRITQLWY